MQRLRPSSTNPRGQHDNAREEGVTAGHVFYFFFLIFYIIYKSI